MQVVKSDEEGLEAAAKVLLAGGVAVIPTDTVYGLAAHPDFPEAVDRLYTIKGREAKKPIALLAASVEATPVKHQLTGKWPGGLTIVFDGEGYRVPDHDWTRRLLAKCGGLLRVTSANLSGQRAATIVVDDGISPGGVPSTVVKVDGGHIEVLRLGACRISDSE